MALNLNQFAPARLRGELDNNQPFGGRVETAVISTSQATALNPGDFVKLDTTTNPGMPRVVAAAVGDVMWGCLIFNKKDASFTAGDLVEVARPGCVVWLTAGASISAGALVEDTGSATIQTKSAQAIRGEIYDIVTSGVLARVMLRNI